MRPAPRLAVVDVLRGLAIAQMVAYHFVYDLHYFGWVDVVQTLDPRWIAWRSAIVSQFLAILGAGLVLRTRAAAPAPAPAPAPAFWRRWSQIAGAALLVSAATVVMFGPRFIWFGILHFGAAALLLSRPLVHLGALNLGIGAIAIAAGLLLKSHAVDPNAISWIGFATGKPASEDFVPLFPWLGVVWIGIGLASPWRDRGYPIAAPIRALAERAPGALAWAGRWPLSIYLLHQPLLMGTLYVVWMLRGGR